MNNLQNILSQHFPDGRVIMDDLPGLYGSSTTGIDRKILAVVKPVNALEIQKIIEIANHEKLKIYPISTGKNWGYSDSQPLEDNSVIVDLSLMNGITDYNDALGYISVEPGVTQKQLADYLKNAGDKYILSVTGSSPDASITGNYLERGFGLAPFFDHAQAVMRVEAILPDGSVYQPALSSLGCPHIDSLYKWGIGAYTDGLFFQSSLGIVTRLTIALARKPESVKLIFIEIENEKSAFDIVGTLHDLRQRCHYDDFLIKIFNGLYTLAGSGVRYPEEYVHSPEALPESVVRGMMDKAGLSTYTALITLSGHDPVLREITKEIKKTLKGKAKKIIVLDVAKLKLASRIKHLIPSQKRKIETLEMLYALMNGQPGSGGLALAYWRTGKAPPIENAHPAQDGCGVIWYAPVMPFAPSSLNDLKIMTQEICIKYGINPLYNCTNYAGSFLVGLVPILYNRETQAQAAQDCFRELLAEGLKRGMFPYRLPTLNAENIFSGADKKFNLTQTIKNTLDPNQIFSPKIFEKNR